MKTFIQKTHLKVFCLLLTICLTTNVAFSQITSTESGGDWDNPATWIGGTVPTPTDDVIINGPVRLLNYDNKCHNLTINPDKMLWAGTGWYGYLTVAGDILNNGTVEGGMDISLAGNVENEGEWIEGQTGVPNLLFIGNDQTISHAPGSGFHTAFMCTDSTANIYFDSDILLWSENSGMGKAEIYTQGHTFKIEGGALHDVRIVSNDTLDFNAELPGGVEISGDYILKGTITAYNTNILRGTATNLGTIQAISGPYILTIDGNINNYGTVSTSVHISGNIDNHGSWTSPETHFTGSNEKILSQGPDAVFEGYFTVDNPDAVITLASDVSLNVTQFTLNNASLNCGPYHLTANNPFINGTIISFSDITQHGTFESVTFEGSIGFHGINHIKNCIVDGDVTNYDTISPPYPIPGNYLRVNGSFENKGLVTTVPINLYGDLTNHGEISTSNIQVQGDTSQTITLSEPINEPVVFLAMVTGISYQWMKNGEDIPDATQSELFFNTLQLSDQGVYQCRIETEAKETVYSREISVNPYTGIDDYLITTSRSVILHQNFPNPFQKATIIPYWLHNDSKVELTVFDMKGSAVKTLVNKVQKAGEHEVEFNATGLPSGIYYYRLVNGKNVRTRKMILNR